MVTGELAQVDVLYTSLVRFLLTLAPSPSKAMGERYHVVAATLHPDGVAEADRIANILRDEGWPRATRSLVIREALERLREELRGKSTEEVFHYFIVRRAKRAAGPPPT